MKHLLLSSNFGVPSDFEELQNQPQFRKATRKMLLACRAADLAVKPVIDIFQNHRSEFGLVCGSLSGELEATKDFLFTLSTTKFARPLLFQNSLHNSTTGFVAIHLGLTAPALTLSHPTLLSQQSLDLAQLLLDQDTCAFMIVLNLETNPKISGVSHYQDACHALILTNERGAKLCGERAEPVTIQSISPLGYRCE